MRVGRGGFQDQDIALVLVRLLLLSSNALAILPLTP